MAEDLVIAEDGVARCGWCSSHDDYRAYHDNEWGQPTRGERQLFELVTLESFQSGLSWLTILRKREGFRKAFADWNPEVVAEFGEAEHARLMADANIVRNRLKIDAAIANAQATVALRERGGLDELIWSFADAAREEQSKRPASLSEVPGSTATSKALAKTMKAAGFKFVGPTVAYALMQSAGLVDDHVAGCHRAQLAG